MRKCVIVKGPPGSGKSTLIETMGWKPYSLAMDDIRIMRKAPSMDATGKIGINLTEQENHSVFAEFLSRIESRLEKGDFVVLEGLFHDDNSKILNMLKDRFYQVAVVDLSTKTTEDILAQNKKRPEFKIVPETAVLKSINKSSSSKKINADVYVSWSSKDDWLDPVKDFVDVKIKDWNAYENICLIGDVQGCKTVLTGPGGPFENGFDEKTMYVFVGDLLDRGIENGAVMRWFVDEALPRNNVSLVWGNHEEHIYRYAAGQHQVSAEFEKVTMPDLELFKISKEEAMAVCKKSEEAIFFEYGDKKVMVTHAGLPTVPVNPVFVSTQQYCKGTGYWSDPVDQQFEAHAPKDWFQVHGHRNHGWQPIQASPRSFSLEDQVEFGGRLRWVTIDKDGFHTHSNKNTVFSLTSSKKIRKLSKSWAIPGNLLSEESLQGLRTHSGVKERAQEGAEHISSFNFKKDVFFSSSWDDVTVRARGFFVNTLTREIVSRGYDKFFNIGEKEECSLENISAKFKFPVTMFLKENGFLGNVGYDSQTQSIFIASKASSSNEYAKMFSEILKEMLGENKMEGMARWLRDNQACMTFEVIDPVNDPHIIEYKKPTAVLLDVFHRNEVSERLPYDELVSLADKFGIPVKKRAIVFEHPDAFKGWISNVSGRIAWTFKGAPIEGFVIEDVDGQMTKFKTAHYSFWKKMRSQKDRLAKAWESLETSGDKDVALKSLRSDFSKRMPQYKAAKAFLSWLVEKEPSEWGKTIVDLKKDFLATNPPDDTWSEPFTHDGSGFVQTEKQQVKP